MSGTMNDQIYDEPNEGYYQYLHICRECSVKLCKTCIERANKERATMVAQCREEAARIERWRIEYETNKDLYDLRDLRVRRYRLLSAGFDADRILVGELIGKQLTATSPDTSVLALRRLFTYLLTYPNFLCKRPKVLGALRGRIQALADDVLAAPLVPLIERLQKVLADV
jgi:hypothetical protein